MNLVNKHKFPDLCCSSSFQSCVYSFCWQLNLLDERHKFVLFEGLRNKAKKSLANSFENLIRVSGSGLVDSASISGQHLVWWFLVYSLILVNTLCLCFLVYSLSVSCRQTAFAIVCGLLFVHNLPVIVNNLYVCYLVYFLSVSCKQTACVIVVYYLWFTLTVNNLCVCVWFALYQSTSCGKLYYWEQDSSVVWVPDFERSLVQIPAGAMGEFSSPGSTFCADSYFGIHSTPMLPQ